MHSLRSLLVLYILFVSLALGKPVTSSVAKISARQQTLFDCLAVHDVPAKFISSADWSSFVTPYNRALSYVPAAVTLPTTTQHVSDSITCAAAAGVKVQAKSGGHSYASFSSGGKSGSLIVDLENFNSISVDNVTFIATVGGGVRLGNLALGIYAQGQRALPHGTCPGVGVGGHFTHGGYGHDSRLWGLALDTIVGMDVVLADGNFVHTTATSYPQLFFALRGAAESFGIVTAFYLQTLPAPSSVINFSVDLSAVLSSASTAANAFLSLQNFVLTSPLVSRNISFGIYTDGNGFSLGGWYFGDKTFFGNTVLPTMLADFPAASSTTIRSLSWLDSLVNEAGGPLAEPLTGYNAHDTFYAKSIVTHNSQPLTLTALTSFFNYVITQGRTGPSWFSIINLYGGIDSQINNVKPGAAPTAYSDRDALWVFQNYGYTSSPPLPPAVTTFVAGLNAALTTAQPDGNFGAYLNYIDPDLSPTWAALLYYGANTYARLAALKKVYDPDTVFWNPQAVGNANLSSGATTTGTAPTSAATSAATPTPTPARTPSPDGSCAGNSGGRYTCAGVAVGGACCSQWGWCGNTAAYCGTGCQRGFGRCDA